MNTDPFPVTCACCGYLSSWGDWEICGVCHWEGDPVQERDPDYVGGANGEFSLRQAQENFRTHGNMYGDDDGLPRDSSRPPARERYKPDPAWRPIADARDLSGSPAEAREAIERLGLEDRWMFTGYASRQADVGALAPIVAEQFTREGWQVADLTNITTHKDGRDLECSAGDAKFTVGLYGAPHLIFAAYPNREHLVAFGPERLGECFLRISELLDLDIARSSLAETSVSDLEDAEMQGEVAFVDWIQYWSAAKVARWGLDTLTRGPFARVEARGNAAAAVWLARDPFIEPMSRARAAEFLGLTLRNICRKDDAIGEWLSIPWP